jgi:glycosyltransferase involved in cell wall biosynthesis
LDYKKILTIGIPVYNGEKFIADTIKSINIPDHLLDVVEIIVSDNCSTDNTANIVKQFTNVKYYKNEDNIGYDRNLHNIFLKANGEFVWPLAADDFLLYNNTVESVINILKKETDLGLVHVGGCPELDKEYDVLMGEEFLRASKFRSGGVSSNIIKKSTWLESNPSSFFDSAWIHFGVVVKIANICKACITKLQYIDENQLALAVPKTWDGKGKSLIVNLKLAKIFKLMQHFGYSSKFQRYAINNIRSSYPKEIIKSKARGLIVTREIIKDFIYCYKDFIGFWLIDLPFLLSPQWFCRYLYNQRDTIK